MMMKFLVGIKWTFSAAIENYDKKFKGFLIKFKFLASKKNFNLQKFMDLFACQNIKRTGE